MKLTIFESVSALLKLHLTSVSHSFSWVAIVINNVSIDASTFAIHVFVFFLMKGLDDSIPRYLRSEGVLKNRKLSVKEVNDFINGFWHHRLNSVQDPPFQVYIHIHYITSLVLKNRCRG